MAENVSLEHTEYSIYVDCLADCVAAYVMTGCIERAERTHKVAKQQVGTTNVG